MTEPQQELAIAPPMPDPKLSLPERRRVGSDACSNCGTGLQGAFCHFCGQPDRHLLRYFPVLLRELLEDLLDLDSRFGRTIKPLLFQPGKLTRDYLDGRRFRYSPPLRVYLFSSILFFLFSALVSSSLIQIQGDESDATGASVPVSELLDEERLGEIEEALQHLPPEQQAEIKATLERSASGDGEVLEINGLDEVDDVPEISFNGRPWNRETNPVAIGWLPDWVNEWINDEVEASPAKAKEISKNPRLMVDQVMDLLPGTMFVLLPIIALLFKFWYLFSGRFYIEHLIFALHNHAFIYICLAALIGLDLLESWASESGRELVATLTNVTGIGLFAWILIYLFVSLKRVYQQGWLLTTAKYCVLGVSYTILLVFVSTVVAVLSFVLL